jgi:hypothetical protein
MSIIDLAIERQKREMAQDSSPNASSFTRDYALDVIAEAIGMIIPIATDLEDRFITISDKPFEISRTIDLINDGTGLTCIRITRGLSLDDGCVVPSATFVFEP